MRILISRFLVTPKKSSAITETVYVPVSCCAGVPEMKYVYGSNLKQEGRLFAVIDNTSSFESTKNDRRI